MLISLRDSAADLGLSSLQKLISSFLCNTHILDKMSSQPSIHYDNMPMQYTAIFHRCKNNNFHMKNCDIFLISASNIAAEEIRCALEDI